MVNILVAVSFGWKIEISVHLYFRLVNKRMKIHKKYKKCLIYVQ